MDKILAFVEELLNFLNEGKAADIVGMVKDSDVVESIIAFFQGLFA